MNSTARLVRIDLTRDLPSRPRPLTPDAVAQIFGGCVGEWQICNDNWECCSTKCLHKTWLPAQNRYEWRCLPGWAT